MQTPAVNMDGPEMTLDKYKTRMNMRDNMIFAGTDCIVFAVEEVSRDTFLYELEVAQGIHNHLVVLIDSEASNIGNSEIMAWQSEKFFASPFFIPGAMVIT